MNFFSWMLRTLLGLTAYSLVSNSIMVTAIESVDPTHPRRCFSCSGLNCRRTSMTEVTSNCTDFLDICVTIFEEFAVAAKGCFLDLPERYRSKCDQRDNPECLKCFGDLCNNMGRKDFKCIQCHTNENSKCASDTFGMIATGCPVPTAPNSYCYVRKSGKHLQRGCLTHVQDQLECLKSNECSLCLSQDGEACNSYQLNTSSDQMSAGISRGMAGGKVASLVMFIFIVGLVTSY